MSTRAKRPANQLIGIPVPLPGMEHVEQERATARAQELQAELTAELLAPKGSIEAVAGTVGLFASVPWQRSKPAS